MTRADGSGHAAEAAAFRALQRNLVPLFEGVFSDPRQPRTVVVVPSLSLDLEMLNTVEGLQHYEERLLCMLMLLRLPRTRVIYCTSLMVDPTIIDYYLHLLPGVPSQHARARLDLIACQDGSVATLTEKLLARPRLLRRLRERIGDPSRAHMSCFHVTAKERTLALRLGVPIFGNDPDLALLGSKSGSRRLFHAAGVPCPDGAEDLRDFADAAEALADLKQRHPDMRRAVVKMEEGASGEGNALYTFPAGPVSADRVQLGLNRQLRPEDTSLDAHGFASRFDTTGGIVEAWVEGEGKRSPSMQGRIDPLGRVEAISTHDQVLGGPTGQVFQGSRFPADAAYRSTITELGMAVGEQLREREALGRFGVDFVSVRDGDTWRHLAIEINLRKGGTTHTYRILQFLTDGQCDPETGLYVTDLGQTRFSYATDNQVNPDYKRLLPRDLIDIAVEHDLHFHRSRQRGVFFHLIGALSEFGKLGLVCVDESPEAARQLALETVALLDREALC